jgi:monovalent cation/hydrogen antiporter
MAWIDASQTGEEKLDPLIFKELKLNYAKRLDSLHTRGDDESEEGHREHVASRQKHIEAMRDVIKVERDTTVRLRNDGRISDEVLRKIEYELDLSETKLATVK